MYTADWCQACKQIKPRIESLAKKYNCDLHILDVDKDLTPDNNIKSLPAFKISQYWAFSYNDVESILKDREF